MKPILKWWLGVSHRVVSALFYWILSEKGKILSQTKVQDITAEEPRDPDVQERICDYHESLEYVLGSEDFGSSLDGYDSFINDDEEDIAKCDPNEERYQGTPDSLEIYKIIDNKDEENLDNSYDQYIGAKVVLPD